MVRHLIFPLFAMLLLSAWQLQAQAGASPQDFNFQVSASQPWTDTGLDLQTGDRSTASIRMQSSLTARHSQFSNADSSLLPSCRLTNLAFLRLIQ